MKLSQEQVAAAKSKDARAKKVTIEAAGETIEVMIRPPTRAEAKAWKALHNSSDEGKSAGANEQLCKFCFLAPEPNSTEFATLLDQHGFLSDTVAGQIKALGGLTAKVELGE